MARNLFIPRGIGPKAGRLWPFTLVALVGALAASSGVSGCAYSIGTGDRRLPEGYRLVAVPVFKNATQEAGVEVPFTNAMIREIERNQIARTVPKADAQVVLEGNIQSVQYLVANQIDDKNPGNQLPLRTILNTEYRIVVAVKLTLRRASDSTTIWSQEFSKEQSYLAPKIGLEGINSANALYNHSARYDNLASMATDMMAEAHSRLTENF